MQPSRGPGRLASTLLYRLDERVRYRLRFDSFETDDVDQQLGKTDRRSNRIMIIR